MKRPLFLCMAALIAGIYAAYFIPDSVPLLLLGLLAFVLFVLLLFKKPVLSWLCAVLFFLGGFFYLSETAQIEKRPLYAFVNEYVTVHGDVIEEPEIDDRGRQKATVRLCYLSFLEESLTLNESVRLTIPAGEKRLFFGDSFSAVCLFSIPPGRQNRGGFDYELYLKSKQIFFIGTVEPHTLNKTGEFPLSPAEKIYALNRRCGESISSLMPKEAAGILRAIAFGDKSEISDELYEKLTICGLSHIIAVSGMHVTIFLSVIFAFLTLLKRNKYKFFLPLCGVVFLFMLFTGASPSVVRAAIMSVLALVAYICFRKEDSLTSLGLAAGIIVLFNPFAAFDVGFILSFGATMGILLFAPPIQNRLFALIHLKASEGFWNMVARGILSVLCVTFSVQIFLLPMLSVIFGSVSLWCFLTNLLVAPLLPVLLVGGLMTGFLGLIHPYVALPVAGFVYPFVKDLLWLVHLFGDWDFGQVTLGAFGIFGFYVYGMLLVSFRYVLFRKYLLSAMVAVGIPVLLTCFLIVQLLFPKASVSFINVGQGDCALISLPGGVTALVDGGGVTYDSDYDVGEEVVMPYLKRAGISRLTYVIASHPHGDHIGGLKTVMEKLSVENVFVPIGFDKSQDGQDFMHLAEEKGIAIKRLAAGETIALGKDSTLEVLMPDEAWLSLFENENDASLVFRFWYGDNSVLFMGDLEQDGTTYLLERIPEPVSTTVLKVGHHGSENATTAEFLNWVEPAYAYIPCGKNHFGHPAASVLARLSEKNTVVYRGDEDFDVTFIFNKETIQSIIKGGSTP